MDYKTVIKFWFNELSPKQWFAVDPSIDENITKIFSKSLESAKSGEYYFWREHTQGRLAEIIILDQFSRNIYRGSKNAFAQDPMALALAQDAVALKVDKELTNTEKSFLYMPYMHSESLIIHDEAVRLFSQEGLEMSLDFELKHKFIIEKFKRYPHRNDILGRESTQEEKDFLDEPGSSF